MFPFRSYLGLLAMSASAFSAEAFRINGVWSTGEISWSEAGGPSIVSVQRANTVTGAFVPLKNEFSPASSGASQVGATSSQAFFRLKDFPVPPTLEGFQNFTEAYGVIETVAGSGTGTQGGKNYWKAEFEGALATTVALSRPHHAIGDRQGNIIIVDKDSHGVVKVTPEGRLFTIAGTHQSGDTGDGPAPGTSLRLNSPNGLWLGEGTNSNIYILDTDNGKVRRVDPNGTMTTLFSVAGGIVGGRGLWVSEDETEAWFCSGNEVKRWAKGAGITVVNDSFVELGNLIMNPAGEMIVTDRGAHQVYRLSRDGEKVTIAGSGAATGVSNHAPALEAPLPGVRGVWTVPTGGYLLANHEGSSVCYLDTANVVHLLVDGARNEHGGDGQWFYESGKKISEVRSVSLDPQGNILICESDGGYIRRIRFLPMTL